MTFTITRARQRIANSGIASFIALALTSPAYAAGSSMPWEAPLQSILESIQGPVAKIMAVIIIIVTGLTLAFGDTSGGGRRMIQIVFGLSIAFAASSFFLSFFSFGGGANAAQAKTIDGFDSGIAGDQRLDPARLTRLCAAEFDDRMWGCGHAVFMIEADDAIDLRAAQVQGIGNRADCILANEPEGGLYVVEDR